MGKRFIAVALVIASACTALHYSTTAQGSVVVSNNPHTFNGPGSQVFVISPAGSGDHDILDKIMLDPNCSSQWVLVTSIDPQQPVMGAEVCGSTMGSSSGSQLATGDAIACPRNYQFVVSFSGTQSGTSSCNVIIGSMPYGGSAYEVVTLALSGVGSGSGSGITVSPKDLDFGENQILTATSSEMVTVKNIGSGTISVGGSLSGSAFQVTPNPGAAFQLGGGSSASFMVTCTPPTLGPHTGTLSFTTSNSGGSASLACTGINSTVVIAPSQVTFASTLVGRPPPQRTVTITGPSAATIEEVTLGSDAIAAGVTLVSNPEGMLLGSGQDIVLAYSAATMHEAGRLGAMSVKVSSDQSATTRVISGEALLGGIGTNPASVDLGAVCIGASAMKSVEVYASEAGDVVVSSLTKPAAPFDAMIVDALPKTLAGNHTGPSATVRVSLTPTTPGDFKDALALASNVPGKPTTEVQVQGIGLAGGISATPAVVHFGAAAPGSTTAIQEVQLTNCGTGDLMFTGATIAGAHAAEFTLIGANPPRTLMPTESEIFMVVMQPDDAGFKTAQLVLQHSAGTTPVDLDGTGDGSGAGVKDRETYYACSTGRGAALWPIALALLALRRRRR